MPQLALVKHLYSSLNVTRVLSVASSTQRLIPRPFLFSQSSKKNHQHRLYQHHGPSLPPQPGPGPADSVRKWKMLGYIAWALFCGLIGAGKVFRDHINAYRLASKIEVESVVDDQLVRYALEMMDKTPAIKALKNDPDFREI
ncbi:hypothetical protein LTR84_003753 [Exophiala bonariae]|uniref:Uncharacterized protein n=1 Tax=Exophiala bonariae TaxID=1690606 RepID=A0AAV9N675_9EURO|nr:hypothetical protein LTR84_003753 [Exophiala bonariae]